MTLTFPNPARNYDETKRCVRFLGHDGLFQINFLLPVEILAVAVSSRTATEGDYLSAFDTMRKRILEIAEKAYAMKRRSMIELDPKSFR